MKRTTSMAITALAVSAASFAAPVSPERAQAYAQAYLRNIAGVENEASGIEPIEFDGKKAMYVVSLAPEGWVLVAADDVIAPVIGYSVEGRLDATSIDPNLRAYLGHFADDIEIRSARGDKPSDSWANDTVPKTNKAATEVSPLVKVNWNQSGKYRQYCPTGTAGDAIVGCVAVGMGQAMSVYRKPARPVGYKSYKSENYGVLSVDYDSEEPYNWSDIINAQSSESDGEECARLLYHLGVSVEMGYSPNGSGVTYMGVVPYALKTYFGYSNKVTNVSKDKYSASEWVDLLKSELSAGRPLIYAGYSNSGGHCFNVDGYNSSDLFHFNFGWGGNGNGYFSISGHEYNSGEKCAINFAPATGTPTGILLSSTTVAKGSPAGTVVATLTADTDKDDCEFSFTASGVKNPVTQKVSDPAFSVDGDKLVTNDVFAKQYGAESSSKFASVNITATNVETLAEFTQQVTITLGKASAIEENTVTEASISQANGVLTITTHGEAASASLFSVDGKLVGINKIAQHASACFSGLSHGVYSLVIKSGARTARHMVLVK